ncbi:MAG: DUF349 domain-containing protein, partial [Gammaproteobacteria bacterium]|nr:DUF349 domain-containing protein [Gammaproteobacteria bacterium]
RVHAALVAAGELEGWQRWSADKVREDLVAKAEGLLKRPEGQALGGRKMQETLRSLREQWKKADQGGVPNHALWKRFDEACNAAHKVVEAWLEKIRADAAEHRAQRLALIEEVKAWAAQADLADLKGHHRALHQFADRWRDAGHVGEKIFAELQPLWNEAFGQARAPFEAAQAASVERRQAMIAEAAELGAMPVLRIDAVKALQQRWQSEAQTVPLDRRQEQKLWDAFRAPIDEAFNRKTAEREKFSAAMSQHDRQVLEASKAVEAANSTGDAQKIRAAIAQLEAAIRGEAPAAPPPAATAPATPPAADGPAVGATGVVAPNQAASEFIESSEQSPAPTDAEASPSAAPSEPSTGSSVEAGVASAPATAGADAGARADGDAGEAANADANAGESTAPAAPPRPAPKPVVAVRGDDRPGNKKAEAAATGRGGRFGDRRDGRSGPGAGGRPNDRGARPGDRGGPGAPGGRGGDRDRPGRFEDRGPRLGDAAFRAQREALERADLALRKLAAQAHGEALTQVLGAWEKRDASQLPSAQELGRAVGSGVRTQWSQALSSSTPGRPDDAAEALLRLEMAAELPTPAEQLEARRAFQLKLLTRRGDPTPAQTWGEDAGKVLAAPYEAASARRLQNALKVLLRK